MSKTTINQLLKMKQDGQKFATITAYDATFASIILYLPTPVVVT